MIKEIINYFKAENEPEAAFGGIMAFTFITKLANALNPYLIFLLLPIFLTYTGQITFICLGLFSLAFASVLYGVDPQLHYNNIILFFELAFIYILFLRDIYALHKHQINRFKKKALPDGYLPNKAFAISFLFICLYAIVLFSIKVYH